MQITYIINGKVFINHKFEEKVLKLENGKIEICEADINIPEGIQCYDAKCNNCKHA